MKKKTIAKEQSTSESKEIKLQKKVPVKRSRKLGLTNDIKNAGSASNMEIEVKEITANSEASEIVADSSAGHSAPDGTSRTSYEKLVHPMNYHEYMKASKFRNGGYR